MLFLLVPPQGLAQNEVYFVAYNVFFGLLTLQFLLTFIVDRPRSPKYKVPDDERMPLLGDVTRSDDVTIVSDVTNKEDTSPAVSLNAWPCIGLDGAFSPLGFRGNF